MDEGDDASDVTVPAAAVRLVTPEEQKAALLKAMLVAPVRALDLLRRVPLLLKQWGWPTDADTIYIVCAWVGAYKLGAQAQRFRVPPALAKYHTWVDFLARAGTNAPMAGQVLDYFTDLQQLLAPV